MFGPFGSRYNRFSPAFYPGLFPGFGFGGVLPSYYPYLAVNGWGRGCCNYGPFFSPFAPFNPFPFTPFRPY